MVVVTRVCDSYNRSDDFVGVVTQFVKRIHRGDHDLEIGVISHDECAQLDSELFKQVFGSVLYPKSLE